MKVKVFDPFVDKKIISNMGGEKIDNFDVALKTLDFLSIHMPLNKDTKNLINIKRIQTMKKTAVIINTARGGIINEKDLDKALNESRNEEEVFIIGGADLYSQTMNIATKLYLTTIRDEISGDKYFPDFDISKWNIIDSNSYKKNDFNSHDFKSEVFIKNS